MLIWQLRHYADIVMHNPIQAVSTANPALANVQKDFAFGHYTIGLFLLIILPLAFC
jgi:hypothetical protein